MLKVLIFFLASAWAVVSSASHMQGEKVMLVKLRAIDLTNDAPLANRKIVYSVEPHQAKSYHELRGGCLFSRKGSYTCKTNKAGEFTLPLLFHFSYYEPDEAASPAGAQFEYLLGSLSLRQNGQLTPCSFQKENAGATRLEIVEVIKGANPIPAEIRF